MGIYFSSNNIDINGYNFIINENRFYKENLSLEKRIAITPDIIKKYKSLNLSVVLPKEYGAHLGISDQDFKDEGVEMLENDESVLSQSDAILQMSILNDENSKKLKKINF